MGLCSFRSLNMAFVSLKSVEITPKLLHQGVIETT